MNQAVRVAITGAAGQIGYALAFRVASGQMFGPDTPVILNLIEFSVTNSGRVRVHFEDGSNLESQTVEAHLLFAILHVLENTQAK